MEEVSSIFSKIIHSFSHISISFKKAHCFKKITSPIFQNHFFIQSTTNPAENPKKYYLFKIKNNFYEKITIANNNINLKIHKIE